MRRFVTAASRGKRVQDRCAAGDRALARPGGSPVSQTFSGKRMADGRLRRGFTLIEVLATLVMMGIVLPVAMHGVSLSLQAAGTARDSAEAVSMAEGKLSELAANTQVASGDQSGDFAPDRPQYQWRASTTLLDLGMEQITVRVTWASRGAERHVDVSTLVYRSGTTSSATGP
jgi:prepilin-type N-terminal cleavage/methylation domain-containing protein